MTDPVQDVANGQLPGGPEPGNAAPAADQSDWPLVRCFPDRPAAGSGGAGGPRGPFAVRTIRNLESATSAGLVRTPYGAWPTAWSRQPHEAQVTGACPKASTRSSSSWARFWQAGHAWPAAAGHPSADGGSGTDSEVLPDGLERTGGAIPWLSYDDHALVIISVRRQQKSGSRHGG